MTAEELLAEYTNRHDRILQPLAVALTSHLQEHLTGVERIDRITARAKSPLRFVDKATKAKEEGGAKYDQPFEQIQDLIGARIIVFYKQDVEVVSDVIHRYYKPIEQRELIPERESEFGYFGKHFILALPEELFDDDADRMRSPVFFELQVKTLFQHAWSEAGHDLAYKSNIELTRLQKRLVALTAAQAWGADQQFAQLHTELNGAQRHEGQ
jgi:ppGpp synthetase/RelA/SpoT-type nucleotidyltranferase